MNDKLSVMSMYVPKKYSEISLPSLIEQVKALPHIWKYFDDAGSASDARPFIPARRGHAAGD